MPSKRPIVAKIREAMRCRSRESRLDRRNHTNSYVNIVHGKPAPVQVFLGSSTVIQFLLSRLGRCAFGAHFGV
jgi:hypothetical protein